jgi:hypothetical protein
LGVSAAHLLRLLLLDRSLGGSAAAATTTAAAPAADVDVLEGLGAGRVQLVEVLALAVREELGDRVGVGLAAGGGDDRSDGVRRGGASGGLDEHQCRDVLHCSAGEAGGLEEGGGGDGWEEERGGGGDGQATGRLTGRSER